MLLRRPEKNSAVHRHSRHILNTGQRMTIDRRLRVNKLFVRRCNIHPRSVRETKMLVPLFEGLQQYVISDYDSSRTIHVIISATLEQHTSYISTFFFLHIYVLLSFQDIRTRTEYSTTAVYTSYSHPAENRGHNYDELL